MHAGLAPYAMADPYGHVYVCWHFGISVFPIVLLVHRSQAIHQIFICNVLFARRL